MTQVAVVGAGRWGRNLVRTFHELGVLAEVVELSPELRAQVQKDFPAVRVSADLSAVLKGPISAIAIATPVATHFEVARMALEAGKDVFVEKPMTLHESEAEELVGLARSKGRVLMVGHLLLYQPAITFIRDFIAQGKLGAVHSLHQERLNLGTARKVENALWSLGVHDVAVLLDLVGSAPESVMVTGQSVLTPKVEDDVYLHMGFRGGVHAHLHCSWLWPEKRRGLTVVGSKGMLCFDEATQAVTFHDKGISPDFKNRDAGAKEVFKGDGQPLTLELKHFLECCTTRAEPISGGAGAAAVVRVLEQATKLLEDA
ncbi:MAG TPA: Gfo/Idh/MocA family oxidoreductase [Bdellovibrionota bacterium]|nr:Gfo/Idh/MocA family oxidoreductase [Bdellovibrionota bacterium]